MDRAVLQRVGHDFEFGIRIDVSHGERGQLAARRIVEFLGLPWDDKVLKFYEHAREKMVRSPTYKDVTQPVYRKSVGRWQHYARHFEPILDKLEPSIKEFGYQ